MRIDEINARLAAIQGEIDNATGDALTALEAEVAALTAERTQIMNEVQTRQQLRANIAAGLITGTPIEPNQEGNNMESRTFTLASEEYRSAFLKNLRGDDMNDTEKRAFTYLTANTTAPLPEVMQNRIIDLIGEAHPIVADVDTLRSGTAISITVAKSIETDAGKSAEGDDANDMKIIFENIDLSGEDYTADVEMSYKMAHMAIPAFENYLITQIAERLGAKLAAGIVSKIKEKMNAANKIQTGINYTNLCAGFGELKRVGAVVVYGTRKAIYNKLVGMLDDSKHPIFQQSINEGAEGALLGAIIKVEDAMGDTELLIGDPKKYLQNEVAPVLIESDKDLKKHKFIYSGYTCQEGNLTDDKAFALVSEA